MIYLRNTTECQKIFIERQTIQTADTREINYITSGDVINIVDAKLEPYSTTEEVEGMISSAVSGAVTEEQMNQAIQSAKTEIEAEIPSLDGYATEEWVQEQGYLTEHQSLSAYSTTEEMNQAIDNAVSGKQDTLISGTNIKTINGESILGNGNIDIQGGGGSYSAGTNIDITDNVISVTGIVVPDVSEFVTSGDVKTQIEGYNYITSANAETQINTALENYYTSAETDTKIEEAIATESARCETTYLKEHQSLSAYSTTEQMNQAIQSAKSEVEAEIPDVSGFVTSGEVKTQIEGYNYVNSGEVDTQINDKIAIESARTDTAIENAIASESARCESTYLKEHQSLSAYSTTVQVEGMISSATSGMATEEWVQEQGYITEHQELSGLFADVQYVSADKKIYFYDKNNTLVGQVDTTDFIKDGMVDNVYISGETLYIVFNTDAGKETIELDLTDIFDASNYYTKTEVDNLFADESARTENTYLKEHQSLSAYSTTEQMNTAINTAIGAESARTDTVIENAIASESARCETTYLKEHQSLSAYSTTEQVEGMISSATEDMATETWVGEQGYLTEHQSLSAYSTTEQMNEAIQSAKSEVEAEIPDVSEFVTSADVETQIVNKNYVTSADVETQIENKNYVTSGDVKTQIEGYNYVNSGDVETQINGKLVDYYTSAETDTKIEEAIASESARCESTYLKEHQSLSAYSTTEQMNEAIQSAKTEVEAEIPDVSDFVTSGDVNTQFSNLVIDWNLASKGYVNNTVKNFVTSAQVETQITNKNYITSADAETQIVNKNYITSADAETQIVNKGYATRYQAKGIAEEEIANAGLATSGDLVTVERVVAGAIDELNTNKQDVLVSGTNVKTINNQSILGSGNIEIQGGGSYSAGTNISITDNVISVTGIVVPDVSEFVTSADVKTQVEEYEYVNSGDVKSQIEEYNYITSGNAETQINTKLEDYYTSAETNSAIENAIASESARCESTYLKEHQSLSAYSTTVQMNTAIQSAKTEVEAEIPDVSEFVTSADVETQVENYHYTTSGDVSTQIANAMTNVVSSTSIHNIVSISQADYDLLPTKDANTLYVITSSN